MINTFCLSMSIQKLLYLEKLTSENKNNTNKITQIRSYHIYLLLKYKYVLFLMYIFIGSSVKFCGDNAEIILK